MYTSTWLRPILLSLIALCISTSIYSQRSISFKTGNFPVLPPRQDVRQSNATQYLFYQADHVLTTTEKGNLKQQGIEILYALHDHLYWVRVSKPMNDDVARNFFDLSPAYKVANDITDRSQSGRLRLTIAPGMSDAVIKAWALENEIILLDTRAYQYGMIDVQASERSIERLISTPWILSLIHI